MALATYPPATSGGIKSVQRGLAASAGTVTITSVDITKAFVNVFGTTSSGSAPIAANLNTASGNLSAPSGNVTATMLYNGTGTGAGTTLSNGTSASTNILGHLAHGWSGNAQNVALNGTTLNPGVTNLVTAVVQGYLSNSTSLVVSGACRWEVVEFN